MNEMASQITSLTTVYSNVYSGADQRKRQSSAPLAFVRGIHRWPVNSPYKRPVTRKMFPFDDVIMENMLSHELRPHQSYLCHIRDAVGVTSNKTIIQLVFISSAFFDLERESRSYSKLSASLMLTDCVTQSNNIISDIIASRRRPKKYSHGSHFNVLCCHDDAIKWKHFQRYWLFVRGICRSPVHSPHKGQWRGALMFSLTCAWINAWVNNREAGGLRRHCAHIYIYIYDVIVMVVWHLSILPIHITFTITSLALAQSFPGFPCTNETTLINIVHIVSNRERHIHIASFCNTDVTYEIIK